MDSVQDSGAGRKRLVAAGSLIGAILASTCCIAPLLLLTLGLGGAWMSNLTALAPYQGYFIVATLVFLGAGYWTVYFKPKQACEDGSYCASPASDRAIKLVLWAATALIALALGVNFIVPFFL
jgi:mercuric ion transport protein